MERHPLPIKPRSVSSSGQGNYPNAHRSYGATPRSVSNSSPVYAPAPTFPPPLAHAAGASAQFEMQQEYLAQLIQLQQNLLAQQIENGRLSMQRLEQENWTQHQSNQNPANYGHPPASSRSPPPVAFPTTAHDTQRARGQQQHVGLPEGAEELSKFNPLLASALARRQRRESSQSLPPPLSPSSSTGPGSTPLTPVNLTFQTQSLANSTSSSTAQYGSAGSGRTSRESYSARGEVSKGARYERNVSPTLSNTPSLVLSKPGEEFPKTGSRDGSEEGGDSVGMSSYTPRPNRIAADTLRLAPSSLASSPTSATAPSPPAPSDSGKATNGGRTTRFSPPTQQEYEEEVLHSDGSTASSRSLSQANSLEYSLSHASLLDNDSPDTSDKSASFESIQIAQLQQQQQSKREEGRRALGRLGLGRPGQLNLNPPRTRGVSEGGVAHQHQYATAMVHDPNAMGMGSAGEHQRSNSESFASALSPFATTFSPPPSAPPFSAHPYHYSSYGLTSFPTPTTAQYPVFSTPNPFAAYLPISPLPSTRAFVASGSGASIGPPKVNYRSASLGGAPIPGTASAIRQPIGPAAEVEFSSKNFSKRIRKNALGVLGRIGTGGRASLGGAVATVVLPVEVESDVEEELEEGEIAE